MDISEEIEDLKDKLHLSAVYGNALLVEKSELEDQLSKIIKEGGARLEVSKKHCLISLNERACTSTIRRLIYQ